MKPLLKAVNLDYNHYTSYANCTRAKFTTPEVDELAVSLATLPVLCFSHRGEVEGYAVLVLNSKQKMKLLHFSFNPHATEWLVPASKADILVN